MIPGVRGLLVCLVATSSVFWAGSSRAGGDGRGGGDHDRARHALEAGEVLPLRTILDRVEREYPGQVLEVELERDGSRWAYEIRTLRSGGSLVKLKVDARDGTVLGVKAREAGGKRAPGGRSGEEY